MRHLITFLRRDLWSPYTAGVLLGLVAVAAMWGADHTVGSSGGFQNLAAYVGLALTSTEQVPAPAVEPAVLDTPTSQDEAFWGTDSAGPAASASQDAAFWGTDSAEPAAPAAAPEPQTVAKEGWEKQYAFFAFTSPKGISWLVWLMVGIFAGSLVSAVLSGGFQISLMPHSAQWQAVFGPQVWKRWALVFGGSVLIAIAAGIAGGCTSGLAIAQGVQLSPAAFLFIMGMFITGPLTALVVYRRRF